MPLPHLITFSRSSVPLMCWHEAGHAWAAIVVDRFPVLVTLCGDPPTHGFVRAPRIRSHGPEERRCVAAAGVAAELWLFTQGRLVTEDGRRLDPSDADDVKLFIGKSVGGTGSRDKVLFFGQDLVEADGMWPADHDRQFARTAEGLSGSMQEHVGLVEGIAEALFERRTLNREDLVTLVKPWTTTAP